MTQHQFNLRDLVRRRPHQAPVEAQEQDSAAVEAQRARLPDRLRRALDREVCPGEEVAWIVPPRDPREGILRLAAICGIGSLVGAIAGVQLFAAVLSFAGLGVLLGVVSLFDRAYHRTFVLTNERCFQLTTWGLGVHVRDVTELHRGLRLRLEDLTRLRDGLWGLDRKRTTGKLRPKGEKARIARDVSPALRKKVTAALMPGEVLRWAERPNARTYFANAPLDALTTFGFLTGFVFLLFGAFAAAHAVPLGAGAALVVGASVNLWRQVRGTVYAVTDRRALVVGPGGRLRSYGPNQLRHFQRTQDASGRGTLAPPGPTGDGFYGVRNVKLVDDLIKQRTPRDASTELAPAEALPGRGDELGPA
jgi:hypothetical protein